jgi:hypothetical protein
MARPRRESNARRRVAQIERKQIRAALTSAKTRALDHAGIPLSRRPTITEHGGRCEDCDGEVRKGERVCWLAGIGVRCWACGPWPTDHEATRVWE